LIPVDKVQAFKQNLAQLPYDERVKQKNLPRESSVLAKRDEPEPRLLTTMYKVKAGESLTAIANKNHTTIDALRKTNHLTNASVRTGMVLQIPVMGSKVSGLNSIAKVANEKSTAAQFYAVKKGDTFFSISQRFSVAAKDVADWNNINLKTSLVPGRKLMIKGATPHATVASAAAQASSHVNNPHSISYIVRHGDSLAQISRKFNVSVTDLRKWNAPSVSKSLTPGKIIKVIISAGNKTT
jgi:membrane-bound lytic murein transglycosylase D